MRTVSELSGKLTTINRRGDMKTDRRIEKEAWVKWLENYGIGKFYDAFVRNAQDAKSECTYCHEAIYLDIVEGGGVPDWKLVDGDYGCEKSPETCEEGLGSHSPIKIND